MTQLSENMESEITKMNLEELWDNYQLLEDELGEDPEYQTEKNAIKNGINIEIDIRWLTNKWYTQYPKTHRAKIQGYKEISLEPFLDEIDLRKKLMRTTLLENLKTLEILKPRINQVEVHPW